MRESRAFIDPTAKVAAAVKQASPATPFVLLTGLGQRVLSDGEIPLNVDRVMSKPPKLIELLSVLADLTQVQVEK